MVFELSVIGRVKQVKAWGAGRDRQPFGESLSSHLIRSSILLLAQSIISYLPIIYPICHVEPFLCVRCTTSEVYRAYKPYAWLDPNTHPNEAGLFTVFILLFCQDHLNFSLPLANVSLPLANLPLANVKIIFLKQYFTVDRSIQLKNSFLLSFF